MFDIDKLINEAYSRTYGDEPLSFEKLAEMVEDMIVLQESLGILQENQQLSPIDPKFFIQSLDKIVIEMPTEQTGKLNSAERNLFERYISDNVAGNNLAQGVQNMNAMVESKQDGLTISQILGRISALRIAKRMITDYTDSSAGFVFEAFLSALYMGRQVTETPGGTLPIDDVRLGVSADGEVGHPVSLKLLGPNTDVHGSLVNLLEFYKNPQMAALAGTKGIEYIVALKNKADRIEFLSFNLTPLGKGKQNFFFWISPLFFDWKKVATKFTELTGKNIIQIVKEEKEKRKLDFPSKKKIDPAENLKIWKDEFKKIAPHLGLPDDDDIFKEVKDINVSSQITKSITAVYGKNAAVEALKNAGDKWKWDSNLGTTGKFFKNQFAEWEKSNPDKKVEITDIEKKIVEDPYILLDKNKEIKKEYEVLKEKYKEFYNNMEALYKTLNIPADKLPTQETKFDNNADGLKNLIIPTSITDWKMNLAAIKNAMKDQDTSLIDYLKKQIKDIIKPHNDAVKKLATSIAEKAKVASTNVINAFNNRQSFFFSAIRTTSSEFKSSIIHVDRMIGRDPSSPGYEAKAYLGTIANVFDSKKSALEKKRQKAGPKTTKGKELTAKIKSLTDDQEIASRLTRWLAGKVGVTSLSEDTNPLSTTGDPLTASDDEQQQITPDQINAYMTWADSLLAGAEDQFAISQLKVRQAGDTYGAIKISDEDIQEAVKHYGEELQKSVIPIYNALAIFTSNINEYFWQTVGHPHSQQPKKPLET